MQIQLKQGEIVEALKQYIAKQGIDLANKTVDIRFTAGRKDAGLSADLSIEEVVATQTITVSTPPPVEAVKPALVKVESVKDAVEAKVADLKTEDAKTEKTATTSLFG